MPERKWDKSQLIFSWTLVQFVIFHFEDIVEILQNFGDRHHIFKKANQNKSELARL